MKKLIYIFCALSILISAPATIAFDQELVDCCIKPCSCLPEEKRRPTCTKQTAEECKRLGGEPVSDCIVCQ